MSPITVALLLLLGASLGEPSPGAERGPRSARRGAHAVALLARRSAANSSAADAGTADKPKVRWARKNVPLKRIRALKEAARARTAPNDDWADWTKPAPPEVAPAQAAPFKAMKAKPASVPPSKPAPTTAAPTMAVSVMVSQVLQPPGSTEAAAGAGRVAGVISNIHKAEAKRGAKKQVAPGASGEALVVAPAAAQESLAGAKAKATADALRAEVEALRMEDDGIPAVLQKGRH